MVLKLIDEVCAYLSSRPFGDWTDLTEITHVFRKRGLTDAEAKSALDFLAKYFLELDESGRRARLIRTFYNLYRRS